MAQKVSEVVRNDASVQANYTPLGYYEGFSIRGFGLDYGTAYQLNGMPLAAEAHIPLENKERIEVIKGISGAETGVISPGGYINFVTKRPVRPGFFGGNLGIQVSVPDEPNSLRPGSQN